MNLIPGIKPNTTGTAQQSRQANICQLTASQMLWEVVCDYIVLKVEVRRAYMTKL